MHFQNIVGFFGTVPETDHWRVARRIAGCRTLRGFRRVRVLTPLGLPDTDGASFESSTHIIY
jgi:hypothetical protein